MGLTCRRDFRAQLVLVSTRPPCSPWRPLKDSGRGYLSVYLSDPLARYPVRAITRPADNKSDPNIETLSYGLFSTCEPMMRKRIVEDGAATVFFVTRHAGKPRAVTGYYQAAWYTEGARGARNRDFALAARAARFIDPLPVADLPDALAPVCAGWYRTFRPVDPEVTKVLRAILDACPDISSAYMREVGRLERFSFARTGYAYPSWGREQGFTWDDAPAYYFRPEAAAAEAPNSSSTGRWRCARCQNVIRNAALLKQCPVCKQMATLVPDH